MSSGHTSTIAAVLVLAVAACGGGGGSGGGSAPPAEPGPASGGDEQQGFARADLDEVLRERRISVRSVGQVHQPFFSVPGARLALSSGGIGGVQELQVFEYPSEAEARAESDLITPEGGHPTTSITWIGDPHFHRRGRLTAIYVGNDPPTLALIGEIFGPQFAGR